MRERALLDDTRQDGEGGDAKRDAHKEGKRQEATPLTQQLRATVEPISKDDAQDKGKDDPRLTDDKSLLRLTLEIFHTQLHTDGKHKEDQSELTEQL